MEGAAYDAARMVTTDERPRPADVRLRCMECSAAPTSRREKSCRYCGAVLPWDQWDELARSRVEVVVTEAQSLEGALARVRRSPRFRRRNRTARRTRARRLRSYRRRVAANTSGRRRYAGDDLGGVAVVGALPLAAIFAVGVSFSSPLLGALVVVLVALGVWIVTRGANRDRARKKRRRWRRSGLTAVLPVAVTSAGAGKSLNSSA